MLCDRILMTAYVQGARTITAAIVRQSIRDLGEAQQASPRRRAGAWGRRSAYAGVAAAVFVGLMGSAFLSPFAQRYAERLTGTRRFAVSQLPAAPVPEPLAATPAPEPLAPAPQPAALQPAALQPREAPAPKPQRQADMRLLQTLWRVKNRAEGSASLARSALQTLHVEQAARELGLAVIPFDAGMAQLQQLSRPCLVAVSLDPSTPQMTLRVFVQAQDDEILTYREPEGVTPIPRRVFEQQWYGAVYLTLAADRYASPTLTQGMQGEPVEKLQHVLQRLGYFQGPVSGFFELQTLTAVKAFQRDHQLDVDGHVGPRTLMLLQHVGGAL